MFFHNQIDYFYQDIRLVSNDYHMSIVELANIILYNDRIKISCMHFNSEDEIKKIEKHGFSLVTKYKKW